MPLYTYACPKCGHEEDDVVHRISAEPAVICEKCTARMKRLVSPTSFQLKGSRWEKDGYA